MKKPTKWQVKIMNKYDIKIFSESKLNIFAVLSDILPENVFDSSFFDTYLPANIEFSAKVGSRSISNFFDYLIDKYALVIDGVYDGISIEGQLFIKTVISDRYKEKWNRLNRLWNTEYNPLKPFDITLDENITDTLDVTEDSSSSNNKNDVYGFNSIEPTPSDTSSSSSSNQYKRENPRTRQYTRVGNIGNTSFQDLVKQEREVLKYQIIDTIYSDIATILCRNKYI